MGNSIALAQSRYTGEKREFVHRTNGVSRNVAALLQFTSSSNNLTSPTRQLRLNMGLFVKFPSIQEGNVANGNSFFRK